MVEKESGIQLNESMIQSRIIHISDLHFGSKDFDSNLWDMVQSDIANHKPNIIIVSGDIVETPLWWPSNFKKAKEGLETLKQKSSCSELIIVPGNHDVAIKGNDISFLRLLSFLRFLFKRRFKKHFGDYYKQFHNKKLFIACFDSTARPFLASGSIEDKEIYQLYDECNKSHPHSLRLAVLHHHPLPIPYSERKGLTNFEPFLVMRNAGTFLRQISDYDFDLILHGHKHYSHFPRINLDPTETRELGVLSAGSPTLRYEEPGRNSYYLITLYVNGNVEIQRFDCGGGQIIHRCPNPKVSLFTIPGRKLRSYRRSAKYQGFEFDTVEHNCEILRDGTSASVIRYIDMKMQGRKKSGRPLLHKIDKGRILKTVLDQNSSNKGFELRIEEETDTELKARIDFGSCIMGNEPISYSIIRKTQASFAMTEEEYRRIRPNDQNIFEEISFRVIFPIKKLKISVKYPISNLEMPEPFLSIIFSPDLIYATIDNEGELDSQPNNNWIRDGEMEDYEKHNLVIGSGEFFVQIDYPIVGYEYKIKWALPKIPKEMIPSNKEYSMIMGETKAYQKMLIRYRNERGRDEKAEAIRKLFSQLHVFLKRKYGSIESETETFSITLTTYDGESGSLLTVEGLKALGNEEKELSWDFKLAPGVGNAGMAYKTGVPINYIADEDVSNYYVPSGKTGTKYNVLLSIPLYHPDSKNILRNLDSPEAIAPQHLILPPIGVINIGSDSSATKLRLVEENELTILRDIVEIFFSGILKILTS